MEKGKKKICVLQEADTKKQAAGLIPETILALLMLTGILVSIRDLGYSDICLYIGILTGISVVLLRQVSERWKNLEEKIRTGIYITGLICFVISVRWLLQGFLFTVNQIFRLWNARFGTERELLAVSDTAGIGSCILWGLMALCIASVILTQLKKKNTGVLLLLCIPAFAFGTILGQSNMWSMVSLLLPSVLGVFIFYSTPARRFGARSSLLLLALCIILGLICLLSSGYQPMSSIERWKYRTAREVEKIRYGEDSLPQGILGKSSGLLEGTENTLEITAENPKEMYLRGFVGGEYNGETWKQLSSENYQGNYGGMLNWLEKEKFEPVTQYAEYQHLSQKENGSVAEDDNIQVNNHGAYRKYLYLPATVSEWNSKGDAPQKDWQIQSTNFFGAAEYQFSSVDAAGTADGFYPASWLENATDDEQNQYLDAEAVYHSFVDEKYLEVGAGLKKLINEMFFSDSTDVSEMDFTELTKQIRRVLRTEADYVEKPQNPSGQDDVISWFLSDYKKGNAVYFASAAVMAYRTAGYPARYVEGYHLSADEAAQMEADGNKRIQLTTQNAHVWVEVYAAGAGWLPVEVVPGMYVETYSNQKVEGRAAYQINVSSDANGISTDQGGSEEAENGKGESEVKETPHVYKIFGMILLVLYVIFVMYLLLELQRAVRLFIRRKEYGYRRPEEISVNEYTKRAEYLMKIAGVHLKHETIKENIEEIQRKIPGITKEELERGAELIQKARFGGKPLKPYEYHALESGLNRMEGFLVNNGNYLKKILFRYWWLLNSYK